MDTPVSGCFSSTISWGLFQAPTHGASRSAEVSED